LNDLKRAAFGHCMPADKTCRCRLHRFDAHRITATVWCAMN
jgi:hypothetical protein